MRPEDSERIPSHLRRPSAFQPPKHVWETLKLISALIKIDQCRLIREAETRPTTNETNVRLRLGIRCRLCAWIKAKKKKPKPQNVTRQFQMIHTCNGFHAEHQALSVPCHANEYNHIIITRFQFQKYHVEARERSWWMHGPSCNSMSIFHISRVQQVQRKVCCCLMIGSDWYALQMISGTGRQQTFRKIPRRI